MGTCSIDGDQNIVEKQMEIISDFQVKLKDKPNEKDKAVKEVVATIREAYFQLLYDHWKKCNSSDAVTRTNKVLEKQTGDFKCVICIRLYDNKLNLFMCIQFHIKKIGGDIVRCNKCQQPFKSKLKRKAHSVLC